jgi:hypothetical protein
MRDPGRRTQLLLLAALAITAAALPQRVETLDEGGVALGESTGAMMFMKSGNGAKKMWTKTEQNPPGTVVRKTIHDVEKHGKCRFACYKDKLCGGYSFVPASRSCELLSAPNFLATKKGNDDWHAAASEITKAEYKKDQMKAETDSIKKGLKNIPKQKSKSVPKKAGDGAPLDLNLENVMNEELQEASVDSGVDTGSDPLKAGDGLTDASQDTLRKFRTFLYTEFYEKYAHEFESRAEAMADRKASALTKLRVKRLNIKTPDNKVGSAEQLKLYSQARKEVDNHAVRHYQRSFAKRLKKWAANKMFMKQEELMREDQAVARKVAEETVQEEEAQAKAKVEGKDVPKNVKAEKVSAEEGNAQSQDAEEPTV